MQYGNQPATIEVPLENLWKVINLGYYFELIWANLGKQFKKITVFFKARARASRSRRFSAFFSPKTLSGKELAIQLTPRILQLDLEDGMTQAVEACRVS